MDHLPSIEDPAYPWPKVPCLCRVEDYDFKGMIGFPEREGWIIDRRLGPVRTSGVVASPEAQGAFVQAWLFFGLLADFFKVCELEVDMQDFIWREGELSFATTRLLKNHLDTLARRVFKPGIWDHREGQISQSLIVVVNFFHKYNSNKTAPNWNGTWDANWSISSVLSTDIILSILILGETLKNAVKELSRVPLIKKQADVSHGEGFRGPKSSESPMQRVNFIQSQNPLSQRFSQEGWCRSEISMLTKEVDNTGLLLASMLKFNFTRNLCHESCTDSRCLALEVTDHDYISVHTDDCPRDASCTEILIAQDKICSILRSGGTPIIYVPVTPEHGQTPKLRIMDYNANGLEYVAISHVWAHGLGNPKANALPSCQILRLKRLTAELVWSSTRRATQCAFWIDTLCIPVDPANREFRKLAITKLANTFRHASQVLVLDADLQRSSRRCSKLELATRILCSSWMKRLWTLQEAVMAEETPNCSKLDIQFLEGPIEFNAVGQSALSLYNTESASKVVYSAFPQFQAKAGIFKFLSRALEHRTTSKVEDEAVCLASILGVNDLKSILNGKTAEQRMQALYTLIGQLPASVLFHRSKRLDAGFRWATASLLGSKRRYTFGGPLANCDAKGLHVQFAGYVVTRHSTQPPTLLDPVRHSFYIGDLQETQPRMWMMFHDDLERNDPKSSLDNDVLFDRLMRETPVPGLVVNPDDSTESALVSVNDEREGVIYATFLSKAFIRRPLYFREDAHQDWKTDFIETREVSENQRWCID